MADIQYSGDYSPHRGDGEGRYGTVHPGSFDGVRVTQLVNWAGAIVSMGLVIGMGIWSWQLLMRDVTEVPVIRALEGPMRIAPTDPGGAVAENQGLAVNRLAEGQEAAPVPDRLVLAPQPISLDAVAPAEAAFANDSVPEMRTTAPAEEEALSDAPSNDISTQTDALIARLLQEAQPLGSAAPAADLPNDDEPPSEPAPAITAGPETIPISIPGVRRSPRPPIRPASISARAPAQAAATLDGIIDDGAGFEIASSELEDGTRLVQVGAFDTADLARAEWGRLSEQFPDFFLGRARVIEEASSGGEAFYRLRAHGFSDLSASRRFCAVLVARGAACIPVTVR